MESLTKKYGLFTAICMVVGIVIGSGIFFKASSVISASGNNSLYSILAWVISGLIMVVITTSFGTLATKYEKVNGVVDYAEVMCGKAYAYYVGWFMSMIYYPSMTAVLAWVSARYTLVLFGYIDEPLFLLSSLKSSLNSPECITLALLYLVVFYFLNVIVPRIAGKFQVSSTLIKLVPIFFIAVVGSVVGLFNGTLLSNFTYSGQAYTGSTGLFPAICSTIFAYEGWIVATSINSEIKNSKRNLPIALCLGMIIIVLAYTLFNIGLLGLAKAPDIAENGTVVAFGFFGSAMAVVINILVVISCLGTLNGLMLGCCRGVYSLAARKEGICPQVFGEVDKKTGIPSNSAVFALLTCAVWFVYFVFAGGGFFDWPLVNKYGFDSSELPIITIYPLYVPILVSMMIKERKMGYVGRFVFPVLSLVGVSVIIAACIIKHGMDNVWYLILFALIMSLGALARYINRRKKNY